MQTELSPEQPRFGSKSAEVAAAEVAATEVAAVPVPDRSSRRPPSRRRREPWPPSSADCPSPEVPGSLSKNDCAIAVPMKLAASVVMNQLPRPNPAPPEPQARSIVPGWRISARVAARASEAGSSPRISPSGHVLGEGLERLLTLLGRQPRERLLVGALDVLGRRGRQHVSIAREGLFVGGLVGAGSESRRPKRFMDRSCSRYSGLENCLD